MPYSVAIWAIGESASIAGIRTVLSGLNIFALSPINPTPQNIITKMHLLNTMLGVILPSSVKAFSIILLRQAYLGIPKELIEAAKLDGAGELKIWRHVMIPGILPSVSTIVIFDFIANWNAFLWPIIVLQDPEKYPLATALQYLNGSFSYKFGYVAAGTVISIIPVLIVFMIFQKNYIEAVSGAVKG